MKVYIDYDANQFRNEDLTHVNANLLQIDPRMSIVWTHEPNRASVINAHVYEPIDPQIRGQINSVIREARLMVQGVA